MRHVISFGMVAWLCLATATAAESRGPGGVVTYTVDPAHPDTDPLDYDGVHLPQPFIAISEVLPPSKACMEAKCWPAVTYLAFNPIRGPDQRITVGCEAFSARGDRIAATSAWVVISADKAALSIILFEGADYDQMRRVDCRVLGFEPA